MLWLVCLLIGLCGGAISTPFILERIEVQKKNDALERRVKAMISTNSQEDLKILPCCLLSSPKNIYHHYRPSLSTGMVVSCDEEMFFPPQLIALIDRGTNDHKYQPNIDEVTTDIWFAAYKKNKGDQTYTVTFYRLYVQNWMCKPVSIAGVHHLYRHPQYEYSWNGDIITDGVPIATYTDVTIEDDRFVFQSTASSDDHAEFINTIEVVCDKEHLDDHKCVCELPHLANHVCDKGESNLLAKQLSEVKNELDRTIKANKVLIEEKQSLQAIVNEHKCPPCPRRHVSSRYLSQFGLLKIEPERGFDKKTRFADESELFTWHLACNICKQTHLGPDSCGCSHICPREIKNDEPSIEYVADIFNKTGEWGVVVPFGINKEYRHFDMIKENILLLEPGDIKETFCNPSITGCKCDPGRSTCDQIHYDPDKHIDKTNEEAIQALVADNVSLPQAADTVLQSGMFVIGPRGPRMIRQKFKADAYFNIIKEVGFIPQRVDISFIPPSGKNLIKPWIENEDSGQAIIHRKNLFPLDEAVMLLIWGKYVYGFIKVIDGSDQHFYLQKLG